MEQKLLMTESMMANHMLAENVVTLTRTDMMRNILNIGKDINFACGYPNFITITDYKTMFAREGMGKRVINLLPEESWKMDPEVFEDETSKETDFEKTWKELELEFHIYSYLQRADILSGIGRYGVLLMGLSDGLDLSLPVPTINEITGEADETPAEHKLLYLRPFDESFIQIKLLEADITSPRFGFPKMYTIQFDESSQLQGTFPSSTTKDVHWSRVLHLADNREVSEVYGVPRQKPVYNRLLDIRKVLSGSGEMFWKGAFPGYSFEINKDVKNPNMDATSIREEFQSYSSGLQRYIALEGVTAKSLEVQVASPKEHLMAQIQNIATTLGVPLRILLGSEQAKLASVTDKDTWNDRLRRRQTQYNTPMIILPFIKRLIGMGVLKTSEKGVHIRWPDLSAPGEKEQAEIANIKTEAMSKYVTSGAAELMEPLDFFVHILGFDIELAKSINDNAGDFIRDVDDTGTEEDDE